MTSIKLAVATRDALRQICPEDVYSNDDIVVALINFYKQRTRHQFSAEAADLISEVAALEQTVFLLNTSTSDLVESTRRLIQMKETGLLQVVDKLISDTKKNAR